MAFPLHAAARDGDVTKIAQLLEKDSDELNINGRDKHKRTALILAAWAGHLVGSVRCTSHAAFLVAVVLLPQPTSPVLVDCFFCRMPPSSCWPVERMCTRQRQTT
jgi:hypothetical protein